MTPRFTGFVRSVLVTEMRSLLRDRRAFLMAVVLPMLLFPLMMFGMESLEQVSEDSLAARRVPIGIDLRALEADLAARVRTALAEEDLHLDIEEVDGGSLVVATDERWPAETEGILDDDHKLLLIAGRSVAPGPPRLLLVLDGSDDLAREGRGRVRGALAAIDDAVRLERLEEYLGQDPGAALASVSRDVAPPEDAVGRALGQLLPIVLVLMLISGASFAALGAFAGEREAGTIETLLVQPVPAMALATGKFLAVFATACVAVFGNSASFLFCLSMGWGDVPGVEGGFAIGTSLGRLLAGLLLFLPTAVLLSAVLCLVSARAKSFREGQHYVFPLVLIASAFALASTQDRIETTALLAVIPVTGATLVLRDTLAGAFPPGMAALSFATSVGWAWIVLRRMAVTLDAERIFRTQDTAGELALRHVQSRRALAWGVGAVALVYIVGGRMQTADPIGGLVATLWLLVPALALASARGTARRAGESIAQVLGLGAPRALHLAGALLVAPGLALGITRLFEWQSRVLPLPSGASAPELFAPFAELSPLALVLLVALSPGWNEELLFRGALLSGLKRDLPAAKVILWQALLFGAVHASIHRFLPTAVVGAVLAMVTLRAARLWPAVLLHAAYNTVLVLEVLDQPWWHPGLAVGLAGLGALLFLVAPRGDRHVR